MPEFPRINVSEFNQLLQGIKAGSQQAFGEFYQKYAQRIVNIAYAYVGKIGLAEDVLDEIMLKIVKLAKKGKYIQKPEGWLITLVKNFCLNIIKKHRRMIFCSEIHVDDNFELAESEMMFYDGLKHIDEKERLVVVLKISFGYTIKEIANELKMSESSIEKIFSKAKEKIIEKF